MPTGHVKIFNSAGNYGFVAADTGEDLYVNGANVTGTPAPGALVEYEVNEDDNGKKQAIGVTVTKDAPPENPSGRTMKNPPSWAELEQRERERRAARRRRR